MNVLFNADDFGLTKGVTDGIVKAHQMGVVSSTTLMMNGKATSYAVESAKQNPSLQVGIHLVLTWGKPIHPDVQDLINENGNFKFDNRFEAFEPPNIYQVKREWKAQLEAFLQTGLALHHIDSHHHVHGWEPLKQVIMELSKEYNVPVRYVESLHDEQDILLTNQLYLDFYSDGIHKDLFKEIQKLNTTSIEIMTHPAIVDQDLIEVSSYQKMREKELEILCSLQCPNWVNLI